MRMGACAVGCSIAHGRAVRVLQLQPLAISLCRRCLHFRVSVAASYLPSRGIYVVENERGKICANPASNKGRPSAKAVVPVIVGTAVAGRSALENTRQRGNHFICFDTQRTQHLTLSYHVSSRTFCLFVSIYRTNLQRCSKRGVPTGEVRFFILFLLIK